MRRLLAPAMAGLVIAAFAVSPVLAVKPDPFCPTAFDAGSVDELATLLTGFLTHDQVAALDKNGNDTLCWLHIPGVGYNILDDGSPR
jgi:hypothetical protein